MWPGSSNTYVVTTGGRQIQLKGAIKHIWSHGTPCGRNGFKCGYCSVGQQSGGWTRLTQHLCGLPCNVKSCSHVPPNVKNILLKQVALAKQKKRDVRETCLEKALMEHDYRTALASLDDESQYESMRMRWQCKSH